MPEDEEWIIWFLAKAIDAILAEACNLTAGATAGIEKKVEDMDHGKQRLDPKYVIGRGR